jgi:hypothetical protein
MPFVEKTVAWTFRAIPINALKAKTPTECWGFKKLLDY